MAQFQSYEELAAAHPDIVTRANESARFEKAREVRQGEFRKRTGIFSASEIHKLLTSKADVADNKTSRDYITQKLYEKATGFPALDGTKAAEMDWGNEHEPAAVAAYYTHKLESGDAVLLECEGDNQKFFKADGYLFGATPDGLVDDKGLLEVKCPHNGGNHLQNLRFASDLAWFRANRWEYWCQVQGAMWATNREWCDFVSFDPGFSRERNPEHRTELRFFGGEFSDKIRLAVVRIERDEDFIDRLKKAVREAEAQLEEMAKAFQI